MFSERFRPGKTEEKGKPETLKLVKPLQEQVTDMTRRRFLALGSAAVTSSLLGAAGGRVSADKIFGSESSRETERSLIEEQLKRYENAREQGVGHWLSEWKENFQKGFDKHGYDFVNAMGEFSEEGLRVRLLTLNSLSGMYSGANSAFFVLYTSLLFTPIKNGIEKHLKNKAELAKDKKLEEFVNRLATKMEDIEKRLQGLESRNDVSREEFDGVVGEISGVVEEVASSPLVLTNPAGETPSPKKE